MIEKYDKIIIGAGIYGMYAAKKILEKKPDTKVLIIEVEKEPFNRGSYINQARLHNGYHYPFPHIYSLINISEILIDMSILGFLFFSKTSSNLLSDKLILSFSLK